MIKLSQDYSMNRKTLHSDVVLEMKIWGSMKSKIVWKHTSTVLDLFNAVNSSKEAQVECTCTRWENW